MIKFDKKLKPGLTLLEKIGVVVQRSRSLNRMRLELFHHIQDLPIRYFDTHPAGDLMSRLTNDIDAVNQAISQNGTSLFASVLSMSGILIAMFVLDKWLALASVLVAPIMFWFTGFVARSTRQGFRTLQKNLGELNSITEEAVSGQKVIKAFRRNDSVLKVFHDHNEAVYTAAVHANSYALLLMPLTGVLGNFFVIVLAGLGGFLALRGLVSVGIIATFIVYGQNFIQPLRQLANLYNAIQAALAGAERIFEIIDTKAEIDDARDEKFSQPLYGKVGFEHVDFAYQPGTPTIKDMTLTAKPGETIALVGSTGAGKTTVINLLTRFYEIDHGRITIDGTDIRMIGSERAGNLSQGQRQLLAISRAILADPDILILDEATSSVDTRTEIRIQTALLKLMKNRTSFVIAHRLSTIRDAGQVVVIDNGKIVEQGTHKELLDRRGFYHHLYLSQFKGEKI